MKRANIYSPVITLCFVLVLSGCGTDSRNNHAAGDYLLTVSAVPAEAGAVSPETEQFNAGDSLEVTAIEHEGWEFERWEGDYTGTENPARFTGHKNMDIRAVFRSEFVKMIGGSGRDDGYAISQTNDGGMILAGISGSADGNFEGYASVLGADFLYVMKLYSSGDIEWIRTFTGSDMPVYATSIFQSIDGGFLVTGYTYANSGDFSSPERDRKNMFVMKLAGTGDTEWIRVFGGTLDDAARSVIETSDGSIIVAGQTASNTVDFEGMHNGHMDGFAMKLGANGVPEWIRTYGGTAADYIFSVTETADGGLAFSGLTESDDGDFSDEITGTGIEDAFVMKTDMDGNIEWVNKFGGSNRDNGTSVITSMDGGLFFTGSTFSHDGDFTGIANGYAKPFVAKLTENGEKQWINIYEGDVSIIYSRGLVEMEDGGIIIFAYSNSNTETYHPMIQIDARIMLIKFSSTGNVEWEKIISGNGDDVANSITKSGGNSVLITGSTESDDGYFSGQHKGGKDIFLIKLNSLGELLLFE